jgi:hypothetical protein
VTCKTKLFLENLPTSLLLCAGKGNNERLTQFMKIILEILHVNYFLTKIKDLHFSATSVATIQIRVL